MLVFFYFAFLALFGSTTIGARDIDIRNPGNNLILKSRFVCSSHAIKTYYRSVNLKINNAKDVERIVISDKLINNLECGESFNDLCKNTNSTSFCMHLSSLLNFNNDYPELQISLCTENIYIYIKSSNSGTIESDSFINLTSSFSSAPCNKQSINSFVNCASVDLDTCRKTCVEGCLFTSCSYQDDNEFEGFCLPNNLKDPDYGSFCRFSDQLSKHVNTNNCAVADSSSNSDMSFFSYLLISGSIILLATIFYYRYQFKKYGKPPFKCIPCCPKFLFPRKEFNPSEQLEF